MKTSCVAAAAVTVTVVLPVIAPVTESVAVIDWLPAVFRITFVKVCDPASAAVKVYVGRQAGSLAVAAGQIDRTLVLVGAAADAIVVLVVRRDGDRPAVPATSGLAKLEVTVK